jgi:hypothetical protein
MRVRANVMGGPLLLHYNYWLDGRVKNSAACTFSQEGPLLLQEQAVAVCTSAYVLI